MKIGFAVRFLSVLIVAAAPSLARADEPVTLKFGFPAPATSYVNTDGMTPWIHDVEKASGGTLKIELFAGPTLGTFRNIYERTLAGVAQISFGTFGAYASLFPRTQVVEMPFLSNNTRASSVALWRLYARGLFAHEYDKVKVLALFTFPGSNLNTTKAIDSIGDVKGLKIAVSSRTLGDVAAILGGSPVTLTPSELYQGMSRGVVDCVMVGWTAVKTFRIDEVTNHHLELPLGQAPAFVFMNKAAYAKLPAKAKHAIDQYSGASFSDRLGTNNEAANRAESKKVAAEPGHTVSQLSPAQYKIWEARLQPIIDDWVKKAPNGAKLLAAYREELAQIRATN
jgi:TRAP-type C4-dicarboxylate transport system substrate-binding protein